MDVRCRKIVTFYFYGQVYSLTLGSTLARSFSDSLDNAFLMSPEIESLSQAVEQK
jgi:hypothetical protein